MVLYTPLASEDIFPQDEEGFQMVSYKGRSISARKIEGKWQLIQLMSSNPEDYLLEEFMPGTILPNEVVQDNG